MDPKKYVTKNLSIEIVNSIIDNLNSKKYLLDRYVKLKKHIDWFVENSDLAILKNRQLMYTYLEESNLLFKAILN